MMNKLGIDNLDIDDLYNNLKVYEADINGSFGSSSYLLNVAFVSTKSTSITNELNASYGVSTAIGRRIAEQPGTQGTRVEMLGMQDIEEDIMVKGMQERRMKKHCAKVRTGLGYDSQFNEKEVLDVKEIEVTETIFDNRSSDEENSLASDRFKKGEGYHAVPPPLTGNYMPPKSDLSFAGLDDSIYKFKISETVTSLTKDDKDALETSTAFVEKTKEGHLQHALKNKRIVNSGCSRHMTRNKAYLANYQEINDGGFVAFSSSRVFAGNQTNKNAGPQDTNDDKAVDDKPKDDTGSKTVEKPINKEDHAYRDELDRLMNQEKEASDAADTLRKEFEQGCMDQRGATKAGITNSFNNVSYLVNAAKADSNNMESSTVVSLIPTHRVHIDHPKDQILEDPKSAIQIRGKEKKSFEAHHFMEPKKVAQALDDEIWVEAMQEELLQFSLQKVKQSEEGIFISQDKYVAKILKRLHQRFHIFMLGKGYLGISKVNLNWAFGILEILHLTWKPIQIVIMLELILTGNPQQEQTIVATSTTEVEYVAAAHYCRHVL
uniref:Uncharacterized protein n=1 Tax=Tanacetum cinerariifolium TaxID=118510 RepID=A0A699HHD0_TANCI|nr:hypothetical protein [Tanacetum cinerariifolium]